MYKLRDYQLRVVEENERLWAEGVQNPCSVLPTGAGKCHRVGTPILMYDGTIKEVQDVLVGDQIMGPDSTPRVVLGLGRGEEMMYEVMPVKGDPYYVNESHILSLRCEMLGRQVRAVPLTEYLKWSQPHPWLGWRVPNILRGDTSPELVALEHVKPVGVEPYYGFEIDGDHLYLLGDFTVTHNTVVASELLRREQQAGGYFAAIAHRQELVAQISLALARQGVVHDIVAPRPIVRFCSDSHVRELGHSYYSAKAPGFVGGVDTVIRRDMKHLKDSVTKLFVDEAHHVTVENKWGKAVQMFPNANGLFVTATPWRGDGKGLGRHADGVIDQFIFGPDMRDLILQGSLCDYRIFAPTSDINLDDMNTGSNGDFSKPELVRRTRKSHIIGDCVTNYQKYAPGTQSVVFTVDVKTAHDIADAFNAAGITTTALSATNTDVERSDALRKFAARDIKVIVNVDLFGEGFDCPAIESILMARPTKSLSLYIQMFGRVLRLLEGKTHGIVIDMVGNVRRLGLPDAPQAWSLDRRPKRQSAPDDALKTKTCPQCISVYPVGPTHCPYCGAGAVAGGQAREVVVVDADLRELSPEELAEMRGDAAKLENAWSVRPGMTKNQVMAVHSHNKTVGAQKELRDVLALYAGALRHIGLSDDQIHVKLWRDHSTNVNLAQTLRPKDAQALIAGLRSELSAWGLDAGDA